LARVGVEDSFQLQEIYVHVSNLNRWTINYSSGIIIKSYGVEAFSFFSGNARVGGV